jgi:hypothetical protein
MRDPRFSDWVDRARAVPIESEIDRRGVKLKRVGGEYVGACPVCGTGEDRFAVNPTKGLWNCRQCEKGGDVIALVEHMDNVDFVAACTTLTGEPPPKANGKDRSGRPWEIVVAEYPYHDTAGNLVFVVERRELQNPDGRFVLKDGKRDKTFKQRRPDPDHPGEWLWNVDGVAAVPYRLPQVIEALAANHPVLVVEGERKVDLLSSWNIVATSNPGGAKKWKAEHSAFFKDADVFLVPDNDDAGWQHVNLVGASLAGIARRIRVVVLPGLQPKGDIFDWAAGGGTREQLGALLNEAPDWQPSPRDESNEDKKAKAKAREDELLEALTQAKGLDYERQRNAAAKELRVSGRAIDAEVRTRREVGAEVAPLHGHWIIEPSAEVAEGDALLRDIIARIRRHVVMPHDDALVIALFWMMSWVHDEVAVHSPILCVTSKEIESGKSTTLGLAGFLMPRCIVSVDITAAALFRSIRRWQPTFAIDEFEDVLKSDDKNKSELRAVINSSHVRNQGVIRCLEPKYIPEVFSTFAAKVIGMVGRDMPPATLSRCIFVELRRSKDSEIYEEFKHEDDAGLSELRSRLLRWSMDNVEALRDAKPTMPFKRRRANNWRLPIAIADLCSGVEDYGDQARKAAEQIESTSDSSSIRTEMLGNVMDKFGEFKCEEMFSTTLVERLNADPDLQWGEWRKGQGITENQLSSILNGGGGRGRKKVGGPYEIRSDHVTIDGVRRRGYKKVQFLDAWERHISPKGVE